MHFLKAIDNKEFNYNFIFVKRAKTIYLNAQFLVQIL